MNFNIKHLALAIAFIGIISRTTSNAQDLNILAGANLNFASNIGTVGLGLDGVYLIDNTWEAAASFTYFFKKNYTKWSMLDFDGHYAFLSDDTKTIYGLAGFNFTFWNIDFGNEFESFFGDANISGTEVGLNLGVGGRLPLKDKLSLGADLKYTIGGFNFLTLGIGAYYSF